MYLLKIISLLALFFNYAYAGNEGAHGGDPYAFEVRELAKAIQNEMKVYERTKPELLAKWNIDSVTFLKYVDSIRVTSADPVDMILNGEEVDALNFPRQNLIKINRARWRESNLSERLILTLHEYFGIIGIERDRYDATSDFTGFISDISKKGAKSHSSLVQLYYGFCGVSPSLGQNSFCTPGSADLEKAKTCAMEKAMNKCAASGNSKCVIFQIDVKLKYSKSFVGAKTCEVLTVLK